MNLVNVWLVAVMLNASTHQMNKTTVIGPMIESDCQEFYRELPAHAPVGYQEIASCGTFSTAFAEVKGCRLLDTPRDGSERNMAYSWTFVDCPKYKQERLK